MKQQKILVMCTGNSFRSHMAQAYLQHFGKGAVDVYSAGVRAGGTVYPFAIRLMAEDGIDISHQTSDSVDRYLHIPFDYVITVCDHARDTCPVFPLPVRNRVHQSFSDYEPQGTLNDDAYMDTLRPIRDAIRKYCRDFVASEIERPAESD